jgi:outer membrane protein
MRVHPQTARPSLTLGAWLVALTISGSALAGAQAPAAAVGPALTLDEAINIARRNNPAYLQTANNRRVADAQVRSAYGALLPSVSSSFSSAYQKGGKQYFNGAELNASSDNLSSSYSLGVGYSVNGATFLSPRAARANRDAVDADVEGSAESLRAQVTQQYISVLQAQARSAVQDTLVATARAQLDLAKAKMGVGAGTVLDVRRAEVGLGQAEVQALTARNNIEIEKLRLWQLLGVPPQPEVQLSTTFAVQQPAFSLDSLLGVARRGHPAVTALRAREKASEIDVKMQRSQYTPTLSLSTGVGGQSFEYTDTDFLIQRARSGAAEGLAACQDQNLIRTRVQLPALDCSSLSFSEADASRIRTENNKFPFAFQRAPFGMSARVSLPLFDNFSREQRVQEASVQRDDAKYAVRARELQLNADVTQAYLNLVTGARTVALQEQNAIKAREELAFAEERYRVGAATFLDVVTSRGTFEQAQIDRINAVYDYHKAFAALENAVGRPLR